MLNQEPEARSRFRPRGALLLLSGSPPQARYSNGKAPHTLRARERRALPERLSRNGPPCSRIFPVWFEVRSTRRHSGQHHVAVNVVLRPKRKNVQRWVILELSGDRFEWNWSQPERTADLLLRSDGRIRDPTLALSRAFGWQMTRNGAQP